MLSPPEPPPGRSAPLEAALGRLQNEMERLQQRVEFLEELLEQRSTRESRVEAQPPLNP